MMHPRKMVGVVLNVTIALVLAFTILSAASQAGYESGQIIVKFAPQVGQVVTEVKDGVISVGIASLDKRMEQYGVCRATQIFAHKSSEMAHIYQFDFDPLYDAKAVARDFAEDEHLLYAVPRYIHRVCDTPNDPNYVNELQWYFNTVHAPDAWEETHGDPSVIIGIVDTGVDWDHPDLAANLWFNLGEDANGNGYFDTPDWNNIDDDANGFVDDFWGWDFDGGTGIPDNFPDEAATFHGTHTAGICAAVTDNELANAGMSWNCKYMALKVARDEEDQIRHGYQGIQYAADNGAAVVNLSWTRADEPSAFEQEVIDSAFAKGVILVAAAGNDEPGNAYAPPDTCPRSYPAAYDHVTAVAATDMSDRVTSFTYYGTWVDVSAPGNGIYSHLWNDSYGMRSSTSAACALVSGVAALVKVGEPDMTSDEFEVRMHTTSDNIDALNPTYVGWLGGGRLNAYRAVADIPDAVEAHDAAGNLPKGHTLSQNHPNPFNPSTTISYGLLAAGQVELSVFNVTGQLVETLVNTVQPAGEHTVMWNGCDREGQPVSSGIYFYSLTVDGWSQAKKMVLMR